MVTKRNIQSPRDVNVCVVGVGQHGLEFCEQLIRLGYNLIGATDIGEKANNPLADYLPAGVTTTVVIERSSTKLITELGREIDVAILAPAVDQSVLLPIAREYLQAGINVLTLHQDFFQKAEPWFSELDAVGKATGASFLATGVQDSWYVQLPNLIAASTLNLREVRLTSVVDLETLSAEVGREVGVGLTPEEFSEHAAAMLDYPAVLGGPLIEAARRMGQKAGVSERAIVGVYDQQDRYWSSAEETLRAGTTIGIVETTRFVTDAEIAFVGEISARMLDEGEAARDTLTLLGEPEISLVISPFPGEPITNVALLNRIPDVLQAPGGVLFSAELSPAQYRTTFSQFQ